MCVVHKLGSGLLETSKRSLGVPVDLQYLFLGWVLELLCEKAPNAADELPYDLYDEVTILSGLSRTKCLIVC
jgi:hypothetical protein